MRRLRLGLLLIVTVAAAIGLPLRTEWTQYRKAVPAERLSTARPGEPAEFGRIRWRLLSYGPARLRPGDLPPDTIEAPRRPGEVLEVVTLDAQSLAGPKDTPELDVAYELRDAAGDRWPADLWHSLILAGQVNRVQVMGTVPEWSRPQLHLVLRRRPADLSPPLGGPMLVFGR